MMSFVAFAPPEAATDAEAAVEEVPVLLVAGLSFEHPDRATTTVADAAAPIVTERFT